MATGTHAHAHDDHEDDGAVHVHIASTPFYVGIFASYLLVLHREGRKFPWRKTLTITGAVLLLLAGIAYIASTKYGYHVVPNWPFLTR